MTMLLISAVCDRCDPPKTLPAPTPPMPRPTPKIDYEYGPVDPMGDPIILPFDDGVPF